MANDYKLNYTDIPIVQKQLKGNRHFQKIELYYL